MGRITAKWRWPALIAALATVLLAVISLAGRLYIVAPDVAVADDKPQLSFDFTDPATIKRARVLFRNYCMDCHGPKLTGEDFDKALLCPNVQGKDLGDYREVVQEGDGDMPAFLISLESDGYLTLSFKDFLLLTEHETTFRPDQP